MNERANDRLIKAADIVARSNPAAWNDLLNELRDYARDRASDCVRAPADQTFIQQGRARHAQELFELFRDCRTTAAKISERTTKK